MLRVIGSLFVGMAPVVLGQLMTDWGWVVPEHKEHLLVATTILSLVTGLISFWVGMMVDKEWRAR